MQTKFYLLLSLLVINNALFPMEKEKEQEFDEEHMHLEKIEARQTGIEPDYEPFLHKRIRQQKSFSEILFDLAYDEIKGEPLDVIKDMEAFIESFMEIELNDDLYYKLCIIDGEGQKKLIRLFFKLIIELKSESLMHKFLGLLVRSKLFASAKNFIAPISRCIPITLTDFRSEFDLFCENLSLVPEDFENLKKTNIGIHIISQVVTFTLPDELEHLFHKLEDNLNNPEEAKRVIYSTMAFFENNGYPDNFLFYFIRQFILVLGNVELRNPNFNKGNDIKELFIEHIIDYINEKKLDIDITPYIF